MFCAMSFSPKPLRCWPRLVRAVMCAPVRRQGAASGGGHDHLRQQQPFQRPGRARALLLMHQRLMHAGKLRGVEAGKRHQRLGLHRVLLVRHGRRAAAARKRDRRFRSVPSAQCPGRTCRGCRSPATASRRSRRAHRAGCAIAAHRQGRVFRQARARTAGALSPSFSSVPAAPPNCTTSRRLDCSDSLS